MTRIEYAINSKFARADMVNRVLTSAEIEKYIRRARREIGIGVNYNVTFE